MSLVTPHAVCELLRPFAACEHEPRVGACANLHREANADFKVDANFNRTRNS